MDCNKKCNKLGVGVSSNTGVGWLALIPNPIIGTNEAWFMTNTEKVHALFELIAEVICVVNSETELMKELAKVLDEFDDTVKEQVENYIKELYESGELKNIVEEIIKTEIESKIRTEGVELTKSTPEFYREFRVLHKALPAITSSVNHTTTDSDNELYSYPQGGVKFTHNNVEYIALAYVCSNYSGYRYNDNGLVEIYNVNLHEKVKSVYLSCGHFNSMAFLNGYLYIVWNHTYDNTTTSTPSNSITRIPFNNFVKTAIETKTVPHLNGINSISSNDNKLYLLSSNREPNPLKVYEYDWTTNTAIEKYNSLGSLTPNKIGTFNGIQDFCMTTNYIYYLMYSPNRIIRYNKIMEVIDYVYDIKDLQNNGMYPVLECESISIDDDGECFLTTGGHTNVKSANRYDITQVFRQNLRTNTYAIKNYNAATNMQEPIELHINKNEATMNPNGSVDNKFYTISEAMLVARLSKIATKYKIILETTNGEDTLFMSGNNTIWLSVNEYDGSYFNGFLGGIVLDGGTLSVFAEPNNTLTLESQSLQGEPTTLATNGIIACRDGNIFLANINISSHGVNKDNVNNALYIRRCNGCIASDVDISSVFGTVGYPAIRSIAQENINNKLDRQSS